MWTFSNKATSLLSPFFQFFLFISWLLSMGEGREQGSDQKLEESLKKNQKNPLSHKKKKIQTTTISPPITKNHNKTKIPTSALATCVWPLLLVLTCGPFFALAGDEAAAPHHPRSSSRHLQNIQMALSFRNVTRVSRVACTLFQAQF